MPNRLEEAGISWVIIGSQTKPNIYPSIEAVQEIVEACDKAGIPVFLKENLREALPIKEPFYWRDKSWVDPRLYSLRQEMPEGEKVKGGKEDGSTL